MLVFLRSKCVKICVFKVRTLMNSYSGRSFSVFTSKSSKKLPQKSEMFGYKVKFGQNFGFQSKKIIAHVITACKNSNIHLICILVAILHKPRVLNQLNQLK